MNKFVTAFVANALLFPFAATLNAAEQSERPNIILFITDDQNREDLACYGGKVLTPHLDRLAREGMRFNSAHVPSTVCTPSRYTLLTGRFPGNSYFEPYLAEYPRGRMGKPAFNVGLEEDNMNIGNVLRESGYVTGLVGKLHLGPHLKDPEEFARYGLYDVSKKNGVKLCGIFATLLADDGVYDANDPNDRLLLGLKGIMSELELQTMCNRLLRGALNKAKRGELFHGVPLGYVILPNGEVAFDPDEQARSVVQLVFDKFDEIGAIYSLFHYLVRHDISLPIRSRGGPNKGELEWRRPTLITVSEILHHPIYAGAYAYGRRVCDRKSRGAGRRLYKQVWKPMDEWKVLIKDRLPAYISWGRYLKNQERIVQNRSGYDTRGTSREGCALLTGLLVCGNCGRQMQVGYRHKHRVHYSCLRHLMQGTEQQCWGLTSSVIDELVSQQVLKALEPAGVELSMKAIEDVDQERGRLDKHWQQRLQRARYEADLAQRRYRAVDPDNRLVASSLEKQWEDALRNERQIQDEYDRFQQQSPTQLTVDERDKIVALWSDIPTLWNDEGTTKTDRKEMIRCLVDKVVVHVRPDSEYVDATIHWQGGYTNHHEFVRPVATYAQLRDFEQLMNRAVELREAGRTASEIADQLNTEGFCPPKRRGQFTAPVIYQLLKRRALIGNERAHDKLLATDEWWLTDLARELEMSHLKLRDWAKRDWVHSRKTPVQGRWILWADEAEVARLRKLVANSRRGVNAYTSEFTTPKERPKPS